MGPVVAAGKVEAAAVAEEVAAEVFVIVTKNVGKGLWQVAPAQPLAQTQENWFTSSTHVPPFMHGEDAHSLMSRQVDCWPLQVRLS